MSLPPPHFPATTPLPATTLLPRNHPTSQMRMSPLLLMLLQPQLRLDEDGRERGRAECKWGSAVEVAIGGDGRDP